MYGFAQKDLFIVSMDADPRIHASVTITDILGRKIYEATSKIIYGKGINRVEYNTANIPEGVYIYSIKIKNTVKTGKVLIFHN